MKFNISGRDQNNENNDKYQLSDDTGETLVPPKTLWKRKSGINRPLASENGSDHRTGAGFTVYEQTAINMCQFVSEYIGDKIALLGCDARLVGDLATNLPIHILQLHRDVACGIIQPVEAVPSCPFTHEAARIHSS